MAGVTSKLHLRILLPFGIINIIPVKTKIGITPHLQQGPQAGGVPNNVNQR